MHKACVANSYHILGNAKEKEWPFWILSFNSWRVLQFDCIRPIKNAFILASLVLSNLV